MYTNKAEYAFFNIFIQFFLLFSPLQSRFTPIYKPLMILCNSKVIHDGCGKTQLTGVSKIFCTKVLRGGKLLTRDNTIHCNGCFLCFYFLGLLIIPSLSPNLGLLIILSIPQPWPTNHTLSIPWPWPTNHTLGIPQPWPSNHVLSIGLLMIYLVFPDLGLLIIHLLFHDLGLLIVH